MKSILLLLLVSLLLTFIIGFVYWCPRHLFHISFSPLPSILIPGQECPLPEINSKVPSGTYIWKNLSPQKIVLRDQTLTMLSCGVGSILCFKYSKRKFALGILKVNISEKPAFFQNKLLVHALGGLEHQYTYCNALEGLEQSLRSNRTFIETDFILTKDNKLVCSHGWTKKSYKLTGVPYPAKNRIMTYETFMNTKIHEKYTTIDAKKIVHTLIGHPQLLMEWDLRTLDKDAAAQTCRSIIENFAQHEHLFSRVLIQIGSPEMYEGIDSVYHFPCYQYFVHKEEASDILPVIDFCKEKGILSLALRDDYYTSDIQDLCRKNGLCILVYTVDDAAAAKEFLENGVDTVCSNFLSDEDLK